MKKVLIILLLLNTFAGKSFSQKKEIIELLPGVTTVEGLQGEIYMYPAFTDAVVSFKNGKNGKGKLNYCYVSNEMLFMTPGGDTLALAGEADIRAVSIEKDSFYYDGQYFLKLSAYFGGLKTATLKTIKETNRKQVGGYGETVTGATRNLTTMTSGKRFVDLKSGDVIVLTRETKYFIGDENNRFLPLNRENVYLLLNGQQQKDLNKYLRKNQVDFKDIRDVEKALAAVTSAPQT